MNIREDRRPTLASWPKRMYDWSEVPPAFQPALTDWDAAGMPPGNITLIPRIHQYSGAPEYVTAWCGNEVCIQRMAGGKLDVWRIRPGDVAQVGYSVQLIKCTVTVWLEAGAGVGVADAMGVGVAMGVTSQPSGCSSAGSGVPCAVPRWVMLLT